MLSVCGFAANRRLLRCSLDSGPPVRDRYSLTVTPYPVWSRCQVPWLHDWDRHPQHFLLAVIHPSIHPDAAADSTSGLHAKGAKRGSLLSLNTGIQRVVVVVVVVKQTAAHSPQRYARIVLQRLNALVDSNLIMALGPPTWRSSYLPVGPCPAGIQESQPRTGFPPTGMTSSLWFTQGFLGHT